MIRPAQSEPLIVPFLLLLPKIYPLQSISTMASKDFTKIIADTSSISALDNLTPEQSTLEAYSSLHSAFNRLWRLCHKPSDLWHWCSLTHRWNNCFSRFRKRFSMWDHSKIFLYALPRNQRSNDDWPCYSND